jgi:hypothetical protein
MKKITIAVTLLLFAFVGFAQPPGNPGNANAKREEKIKSIYIAFMTQQLNLTSDDAQKFWPVAFQYEAEVRGLGFGNNELDREEKILAIKKKYQPSFVKILGTERANTFYVKDAEFKRRLLEKLKQLRQRREGKMKPEKAPKITE